MGSKEYFRKKRSIKGYCKCSLGQSFQIAHCVCLRGSSEKLVVRRGEKEEYLLQNS